MTAPHRSSGDLRRTVSLFRRFMGRPRVYALGFALLVIEAATAVVEPYPIAYLIDYLQGARPTLRELGGPELISSARMETILLLTLAIVLIAAINSAADSLTEVCMAHGGRSLGYSIRVALYSHLQRLPLAYHDKRRTGDVLTRVTGDVLVVEDFVVKSVSNILGSLLVLFGSFAFLLYQSWKVASVALVVVPMLALISNHYSRRIKVASKTQRDREGDLASTAQEMLTSIRLVQSYGRGTVDLEQFSDQTRRSMHASVSAANIQAQFSFVIALTEALSISAVIWLGVVLFDNGAITIGTLVLFVLLLQNMFKPARKIVSEWYKIGKVFASVERIQDLLDREVVVRDEPDAIPAPPFEGRLTFRNVVFAYPVEHEDGSRAASRPKVLDDISFDVAPGQVVALVGYSGAGKSTVAQLVPRLYDPDEGEVLIDGHAVRRLTLASLRAQVSVVLQDTVLLSGTVAENIGYGIANATREDIETAARMANAHDFIADLPDGYETILGERGSTLSGGQRQRLAIARAFIRHAPVLILDEPTTGLDVESAQSVVSALRTLMRNTTTIVISHDSSLIRGADRVLVISGGRIVEEGRHDTLVRSGGAYAELYARGVAPAGGIAAEATSPAEPSATGADEDPPRLLAGVLDHLPDLAKALDEGFVADQIRPMLAEDAAIERLSAEKLWVRDDGSCSLRYELGLATGSGPVTRETLLGRVHPDAAAAASHSEHVRRLSFDWRAAHQPPHPWHHVSAVATGAALTLTRFPVDPDLPTLPLAMDPQILAGLEPFAGSDAPPAVTVVHHPRHGACVLEYRVHRRPSHVRGQPPSAFFGKVYGDDTGAVVDGFLQALTRTGRGADGRYPAAFPAPVLYDSTLRLLLTTGLPGEPVVVRMLKEMFRSGRAQETDESADVGGTLRATGRALAALHRSDLATAPVHSMADEMAALRRELVVVEKIWPTVADAVRLGVDALPQEPGTAGDLVLSHGDFTPSQVLVSNGTQALVDLDTLCWADPALDLGRYLAHLHLLAVKLGGRSATGLVDDLTGEFLQGYVEAGGHAATAAAGSGVRFYKGTSLARTALHASRQLKVGRLEIAMSLLDDIHAGRAAL